MGGGAMRSASQRLSVRVFCTVACTLLAVVASGEPMYRVPDAELLVTEFGELPNYSSSGSTLDSRVAAAGGGVLFELTLGGSDAGKIGLGEDDWPLNPAAGLDPDPGGGGTSAHPNSSLAAYDGYAMWIAYTSGPAGSDIDVSLILNTGLTGPSGSPSNDWTNDTFWQSPWTNVALGQSALLLLDFDAAEAWNITDNKYPHTAWDDGDVENGDLYAINDRDRHEISNIGLQIADFDGDALDHQVELHLNAHTPEPLSMAFMASAFVGVAAWRLRKRGREDATGPRH